jgi:hypothetical protein
MDKCKVHGFEYDRDDDNDDCPRCSAIFWECEFHHIRGIVSKICDLVKSCKTGEEVSLECYKILKKEGLI